MSKKYVSILFLMFCFLDAKTQICEQKSLEPTVPSGDSKCGMQAAMDWLQAFYPDYYASTMAYKHSQPPPLSSISTLYTIPIVVHVIHNGDAVGVNENISDAQILSQIEVLNDDFRRLNADASNTPAAFLGLAADIEIEFCMAQRDPSGNPTNGIHRYNGGQVGWTQSEIESLLKPSTIWDRDKYINIWIVEFESTVTINGYAYLPLPPADVDGIVVKHQSFGTMGSAIFPSNGGRTLTHEMGHFFNLGHIWGDDLGCTLDDGISDTPQQKANNFGCPTYPNVTGTGSSCSDPNGSMFMNYMDYTNDACMNLFTLGQKTKMVAALLGPRSALLSSDGCTPTTAIPIADFTSFNTSICAGANVSFTNTSLYATSYTWSFPGGTPASSTNSNPSIVYNTPGTYNVTLTATNAYGSDVQTYTGFVTVTTCASTSCQTRTNAVSSSFAFYYFTGGGYLSGHNVVQDMAKADYFNYTGSPTTISSMRAFFIKASSTNPSAYVQFTIWDDDGPSGAPGTVLGSKNVLIQDIVDSIYTAPVPDYYRYTANFTTPINISGPFYAGVKYFYPSTTGNDTIAILSTGDGIYSGSSPSAWTQSSTGAWASYASSYSLDVAHHIYLKIGDLPNASFTASTTSVCPGETFTLNNASSNASTYNWTMPGGSPSSSSLAIPSLSYSTSGTKSITLIASNSCGSDSYTSTVNITANPSITASYTGGTICPGSAAALSASGAGAGGTYEWMAPSFAYTGSTVTVYPTSTTTYTVIGTNSAGCSSSATVTVNVNSSTVSLSATQSEICVGGSSTISATPSTGSFSWSPSTGLSSTTTNTVIASPTTTTTYICTHTSTSGCVSSASYTITIIPPPTVAITAGAAWVCSGNSTTLAASLSGTSSTGSYTWSPSAGLSATTGATVNAAPSSTTIYTVVWSDGACSASATQEIQVETLPNITINSTENPVCPDAVVTLTASGAASGNYSWGTTLGNTYVVSPSATTTYTCTWQGAICEVESTFTQNVFTTSAPVISQSENLLIVNSTDDVQWYMDGSIVAGATNDTLTPTADGTYTCIMTDINGCPTTSNAIYCNWSDIGDLEIMEIEILPNPFQDMLQIKTSDFINLKIYDARGVLLINENTVGIKNIETVSWAKGIYFVQISDKEKIIATKKYIKN